MPTSRLSNVSPNQLLGLRALRVKAHSPGAQDQEAMRNRIILIDWLARLDGRMDPSHPKYGTYTGLYQEFLQLEANTKQD